ncbi:carbohydrate porin [Chromobacterium haemolyticum]|uniref:Carbohydrate porin n=1 Tax=Chromobacterium fluminis TaxID=3044269 RepID=A0ABX0L8A5_9NEIS|nr:carbohydrate porin [Chromobacterium haemolyticum]
MPTLFSTNPRPFLLALGLTLGVLLSPAIAQADSGRDDIPAWNGTVLGFEPQAGDLLSRRLGLRQALQAFGFEYQLAHISQTAYNAKGGYNTDKKAEYIDQFSLTFTQNLEMLTGIPDAAIEGNIVNRNHDNNLTSTRLQDPRVGFNDLAQESWGGQSITRLGWLNFRRSFLDGKLQWRIGLMNKVQDFDQIIPCDFQMLSLCGGKSADSGTWYNWNVHYWGSTVQYRLTPELTLLTGLLEQNPQAPSRSHAWSVSTDGSRGILLPLEAEWRTRRFGLPGIYSLGLLYTNAKQTDLYLGQSGGPGAVDPAGYRQYRNTWFLYTGFNQQLTRHADNVNRGLSMSWSLSLADQRSNKSRYSSSLALRYRGPFDARPNDWLALGVAKMQGSANFRRGQNFLNQQNEAEDYSDPRYAPLPESSVNAELYYRFKATPWLELQPLIQYWGRPGGIAQTSDAWVVGLKTAINF